MPKRPQSRKSEAPVSSGPFLSLSTILPVLLGAFFGLCLLKFSNPPIMEKYVDRPGSFFEALAINPWPIAWAYWLLALLVVAVGIGLAVSSHFRTAVTQSLAKAFHASTRSRVLLFLPLLWLGWQYISSQLSLSHELSRETVVHYAACVACFYLGFVCLAVRKDLWPFFIPILAAFALVIAIGLDQHFGGLQEMRDNVYKEIQLYPEKKYPPEFIKKIGSTRIFSTLFYPNTLAGALLLFGPVMLMATTDSASRWRLGKASRLQTIAVLIGLTFLCIFLYLLNSHVGLAFAAVFGLSLVFPVPRIVPLTVLSAGILAVLFWSGSKAGWLLALSLIVVLFLSIDLRAVSIGPTMKRGLVVALVVAGLAGFFVRYATFFKKGATSVSARFDYWHAAAQTAATHPLVGTGPGTFQIPYSRLKRPESEMARLAHNDYLQQASDSGIPGAFLYIGFIALGLTVGRPRTKEHKSANTQVLSAAFLLWLGLLGWAAQCFVEFSLQIPALAWPAFAVMGYLCSCVSTASEHTSIKPGHPTS